MACPSSSLSCGLWGQTRGGAPGAQAHPGASSPLPSPAEPHHPMSLRMLQDFLPGRGHGCLVYIPQEQQGPRSKASLLPGSRMGLVLRRGSLWLCALSLVVGFKPSALRTRGTGTSCPPGSAWDRDSVLSFIIGLPFLSLMVHLVRGNSNVVSGIRRI